MSNIGRTQKARTTVIGERLTEARHAHGWRQRDVAARADLAQSQITQWERGAFEPSLDNLIALADVLEVSLDWLVGRTSSPTPTATAEATEPGTAVTRCPAPDRDAAPDATGADVNTSSAVTGAAAAGD